MVLSPIVYTPPGESVPSDRLSRKGNEQNDHDDGSNEIAGDWHGKWDAVMASPKSSMREGTPFVVLDDEPKLAKARQAVDRAIKRRPAEKCECVAHPIVR
jgi:hypothetical protein